MSDYVVAEATHNGKTLKIYQDNGCDPREWDNLTTMICFHGRYSLGDKHDYNHDNYDSWEELEAAIIKNEKPLVILPLYLYDHSGITMNTTGFSCNWDSGQVGFVIVTNKQIDLLGCTINNDEDWNDYLERLKQQAIGEVETYDQYIRGDVYRFEVEDDDGEESHSCGGFFGNDWKTNGMGDHIDEKLLDQL